MIQKHGSTDSQSPPTTSWTNNAKAKIAIEFAQQAEKLAQYTPQQENDKTGSTQAIEAKFITAQDPIIQTENGGRLPAVPLEDALRLNRLRDMLDDRDPQESGPAKFGTREAIDGTIHGVQPPDDPQNRQSTEVDAPLERALPPTQTNPLFPPLPMYGPPTAMRNFHSLCFRASSAVLSFCFLLVIILGAFFTSIPGALDVILMRIVGRDPATRRQFHSEEVRRARLRTEAEKAWARRKESEGGRRDRERGKQKKDIAEEDFIPTEGGPDPLVCDVGYYARRVGLDCETFYVQTEDGFIIELWHLFNPLTFKPNPPEDHEPRSPDIFTTEANEPPSNFVNRKYPVLLIHGLLQSSGAYCCTDEHSLAFYLAKSGLDVWLGNNRCGFKPSHAMLQARDPRMWNWNIRQMGVLDLPALISRVLQETGFEKLALIAHSQGTTQTLVALAKEQRPEIGDKISVVCLLAPAAYAGPLIGKMYFKFMRVISHGMFRAIFGIHAFIPFMMSMHRMLPGKFYGFMGYRVFSFLFDWTDTRWDKGLRDRCFQFAPVYVSAESMRWWLGRECFAKQRCILGTNVEMRMEDQEDAEEEERQRKQEEEEDDKSPSPDWGNKHAIQKHREDRARFAWYDEHVPPFAIWVAGNDDLVDGKRLLRRFHKGREPFVRIVHEKIVPEYEHLDVIWAVDMIDQVGREALECIWKTLPTQYRGNVRIPQGCNSVEFWEDRKEACGASGV